MKQRNLYALSYRGHKLLYTKIALPFIFFFFLSAGFANAQCPGGYSQVTLNWDYLDYFSYTGNYTSANGYLSGNAQAQTQIFSFGTQRLTITNGYAAANNLGENALHTGDAGSYGIGSQDINFNGNGTITFTFDNEVQNLKFSIYDLDNSQSATVTAVNAASVAQLITMAKTNVASALVIAGSGTTSAVATSLLVGAQGNASTLASLNIDIAGPVKTITINMGATAGDFWISNIIACSAGIFPVNYYNISKPFTGQPGYVLHAFDKSVYALNPANGVTKLLFTDAAAPGSINSMGYDPYNRILYYVYSLTASPGTNRVLKKYDLNTQTISTVLSDLSSATYGTGVGMPITNVSGVESGAAAFYNGSLYLGIETSNAGRNSSREAIIWRIDFDGSNTPYRASQVFGLPVDNGSGTLLHDWSDFCLNNGILYDFDGAGVNTQTDIYHFNMITGAGTNYPLPIGFTPGQTAIDWAGQLYQIHGPSAAVNPYVAPYNYNGTIGTKTNITTTPALFSPFPSLGDASEGFRPLGDFGDAPASYDPAASDPAVHELDANLRLGAAESLEWVTRGQTALANSDNNEDGIGAAPNLSFNGTVNYTVSNISVYNNTGANATLIAWLDYNMNGVFDPGEGRSVTVATSASAQLKTLTWTGIFVPNTAASNTYLRLRLTKAANGMTTANPTGYMPDGEVEDYTVVMGINLPLAITSFDLQKGNGKTANLAWTTTGNIAELTAFDIERSADGQQWSKVGSINTANIAAGTYQFSYKDENALSGKSYYRVKALLNDGKYKYTEVKSISFSYLKGKITVSPNPANDYVIIQLSSEHNSVLKITLYDYSGKKVYQKNASITAGDNSIRLTDLKTVTPGVYYIKLNIEEEAFTEKLIISKN